MSYINTFPDHVFYFIAELCLLIRLRSKRTAAGLSIHTQELLLMVFLTRYLDIFDSHSKVHCIIKMGCIFCTASLILMVRRTEPFKTSYSTFQGETALQHYVNIVLPCAILTIMAYLLVGPLSWIEISWIFSVLLETVAMVPQLTLLHQHSETEGVPVSYILLLAIFRCLFVLNYIYRFFYDHYFDSVGLIEHIFALIHTVVYFMLFVVFIRM